MRFGDRTQSGSQVSTWLNNPGSISITSGATISRVGDAYLLTATSFSEIQVVNNPLYVQALVVGGGGGGGRTTSSTADQAGGGGGGGAVWFGYLLLEPGDYELSIGSAGSGATSVITTATAGNTSGIYGLDLGDYLVEAPGGAPGRNGGSINTAGFDGGCGGGVSNGGLFGSRALAGQYGAFGNGAGSAGGSSSNGGTGGGGAGTSSLATTTNAGSAGGDGKVIPFDYLGASFQPGAGGGGGGFAAGSGGTGGSGGGGAGGTNGNGSNGSGTGSGGGGAGRDTGGPYNGGNGTAGIVYIRWTPPGYTP